MSQHRFKKNALPEPDVVGVGGAAAAIGTPAVSAPAVAHGPQIPLQKGNVRVQ